MRALFDSYVLLVTVLLLGCNFVAFAASDIESYLQVVAKRCEQTYFPLQDAVGVKSVVHFQLESDGRISNIRVIQGPHYRHGGQPSALEYAELKDAIIKLAPLPKPPENLKYPVIVVMVFDDTHKGELLTIKASLLKLSNSSVLSGK